MLDSIVSLKYKWKTSTEKEGRGQDELKVCRDGGRVN